MLRLISGFLLLLSLLIFSLNNAAKAETTISYTAATYTYNNVIISSMPDKATRIAIAFQEDEDIYTLGKKVTPFLLFANNSISPRYINHSFYTFSKSSALKTVPIYIIIHDYRI